MALISCPGDRVVLRLERAKHVVGVVLDDEILDGAALRPPPAC